jgi:hypothetical protein
MIRAIFKEGLQKRLRRAHVKLALENRVLRSVTAVFDQNMVIHDLKSKYVGPRQIC